MQGSRTGTHHEQELNSRKVSKNILRWAIDEIFFFRVTVPVEKYIQSGVLSSPRLLFRIFTAVSFSHINISSRHKNFPEHPETDAWVGNLTPPSGESAHYSIGKIKIVSDWIIQENDLDRQMVKMQRTFKITNQMSVVAISST